MISEMQMKRHLNDNSVGFSHMGCWRPWVDLILVRASDAVGSGLFIPVWVWKNYPCN